MVYSRYIGASGATSWTSALISGPIVSARPVLTTYPRGAEIHQVVVAGERAPREDGDLHGLEVTRPSEGVMKPGLRAGVARPLLGAEGRGRGAFVERNVLHDARRPHARQRAQPVQEVEMEPRPLGAVLEARLLGRDLEGEDVPGVITRIHVAQLGVAPQQQSRADEERSEEHTSELQPL